MSTALVGNGINGRALVNGLGHLIPAPTHGRQVMYPDGNTGDIIAVIRYADAHTDINAMSKFAKTLRRKTLVDTCRAIYDFWKSNIKYKEDPQGIQDIKSPQQLWHDKVGDCKSFSVAVASCLKNLGIPYVYRLVSFNSLRKTPTHVYVVVPLKNSEIILDCVYDAFNQEKSYQHKIEIPMTQISYVHGIPQMDAEYSTVLQLPDSFLETGELTDSDLLLSAAKQRLAVDHRNLKRMSMQRGIHGVASRKAEKYLDLIDAINDIQKYAHDDDRVGIIVKDFDEGKYNISQFLHNINDDQERFRVRAMKAKERSISQFLQTKEGRIKQLTERITKNQVLLDQAKRDGKKQAAINHQSRIDVLQQKLRETEAISGIGTAYIGKTKFGKFLQKAAKGVKKAATKVAKVVVKVATAPLRLLMKGLLEISIPKAASSFIYLFINKQEIIDKLPSKVKSRRSKQVKIADFIVHAIGMKRSHFMGLVRTGIKKRFGKDPEAVLGERLKMKISGVGVVPGVGPSPTEAVGALTEIINLIMKIFGKKPPGELSDMSDAVPSADDFTGLTESGINPGELAAEINNQPTEDSVSITAEDITVSEDGGKKTSWC